MSWWYEKRSAKAPPKNGLKLSKAGTTWWGTRWIEALTTVLRGDSGRLSRGKSYARAGRTHDLVIEDGAVRAKVTGSAPEPYDIRIRLMPLSDGQWTKAVAAMAAKAQFSAELLAGRMPREIDELFQAAGTSLFPATRRDLAADCSCPDSGDPCKHVAATHYVLGEALDRDPFLLFELRGRTKAQVLAALRNARGAAEEPAPTLTVKPKRGARSTKPRASEGPEEPSTPSVTLGALDAADYDRPRSALPTLHFSFELPSKPGALLRQLGTPPAWSGEQSPAELLEPVVAAAAERARAMALAEPVTDDRPVEAPKRRRRGAAANSR
jgi:uncharacterized Zn finger protein